MSAYKNYSIAGKILHVNLTSGSIYTELTLNYAEKLLGGRGINSWILYKGVKPSVDPFDPANKLIFGTGVLGGTSAPCSARFSVEAKSPVTGGAGSANAGGGFLRSLKTQGTIIL